MTETQRMRVTFEYDVWVDEDDPEDMYDLADFEQEYLVGELHKLFKARQVYVTPVLRDIE